MTSPSKRKLGAAALISSAAAAVVFADAEAPAQLTRKAPPARISVIPDPHAEIAPDAFTRAEFADALAKIYAYATREN